MVNLKFLELLFPTPKICPSCHKDMEDLIFCEECKKWLKEFAEIEGKCKRCGTFGVTENDEFCENCKDWNDKYLSNLSAVPYLKNYERIIKQFKFNHGEYLKRSMASLMIDELLRKGIEFDLILPIPIHKKSLRDRGYNQAFLLAEEIARVFEKKVYTNILLRKSESSIQSGLNRKERSKNSEGVFSVFKKEDIIGKKVLIVDDVITTGVTLKTATEVLIYSGAESISSITFAAGYLGGINYGS